METTGQEVKALERIRVWWRDLTPRVRQRIVLGGLVGASVAARDVLLLAFAGGMLASLELAPEAPNGPRPAV